MKTDANPILKDFSDRPKTYEIPFLGNIRAARDNYSLTAIISIYKKLCITQSFLLFVGAFIERPRATTGRPYGTGRFNL